MRVHSNSTGARAYFTIATSRRVAVRLQGLAGVGLLIVALLFGGCAPLKIYNALAPSDTGGILIKSDAAYGSLPRQHLDVYAPANGAKAAPVVVVIYGGSWNSGSKADYAFLGKALASRGFVAMVIDYRIVPEVRFPAFLEDCARAVVWARDNAGQFGGDPGRLFLLGHSAGAYNAVMIALDAHYLAAFGAGPTIIRGLAALAGPYDFLPLDVESTVQAFGHAKDLSLTQPINFVSHTTPAMFLATGADDTTVYPRNTFGLAEKLRRAGNSVEVRSYPGLGHVDILLALSVTFRGKAPVLDDVVQFINGRR